MLSLPGTSADLALNVACHFRVVFRIYRSLSGQPKTTEQPTAGAGDLTGSSVIKIPTFYISGTKKKTVGSGSDFGLIESYKVNVPRGVFKMDLQSTARSNQTRGI